MYRKIVPIILILTIIFLPFFTTNAAGDPMTAYGYQVTVWKYSGSGSPQQVGKPILIYHPDLFDDIFVHKSVATPTTYSSLMSKNWGLSQIIDKENDWSDTKNGTGDGDGLFVDGLFENPNIGGGNRVVVDQYGNEYTIYNQYFYTYDKNSPQNYQAPQTVCGESNRTSGNAGYQHYIISYQSKDRKITYHGSDITNLGDYYKTYADSNLTEYNVNNNGYLDNIIKNKYFKDVQAIKTYFGIDIDYSQIDKYYISVEPVQRVLDGIKKLTGSYLIQTITNVVKETYTWTVDSWTRSDSKDCNPTKSCKYTGPSGCDECDSGGYSDCNGVPVKCSESCRTVYQDYSYSLSTQFVGIKNFHQIYGKYADGYSHIQTSRSLGSSSVYLNRAVDYCDNIDNKHCELESDNVTCKKDSKGNIIYQYYIGPSLDKALVGTTSNNYYLLNGSCSNGATGRKETGIKHYYLEDLVSCKNTCGSYISDKSSDEYLKCAENYCDAEVDFGLKGNARLRKKNCIISCGYTYGKSPTTGSKTDPDRESINSCNNASPYNGIAKANVVVDTTSQCSIDKLTGNDLSQTNAIITSCIGDQITDFDDDDTNDTIFDHRTYINIACKETSSFSFVDLSNKPLVAGEGIDYYANLDGEKECTVYFNLEQWKFDYATISSKDPDRRKRLLYIYNVYNNALDNSYDRKKDPYYDPDFLSQRDGEINWTDFQYDISKVSVISQVREIVNNIVKVTDKYNLVVKEKEEGTNATIVGKETIKEVKNMTLTNKTVNRYIQTSRVLASYTFDKYCVSLDGKATVYKAPSNGVCYTTNGEDIIGRNVYYTDLNATANNKFATAIKNNGLGHSVITDVSIGREVANENTYYKDGENCPYIIKDTTSDELECIIEITPNEGTIMHGNDIYVNGGVSVNLKISEQLGVNDNIASYGLIKGNTPTVNGVKTISVDISDKKNGIESIELSGIVESKNGKTAICKKKISIIHPDDNCGVSCSINKYNDNGVYEIKSTGRNTPKQYLTALSTNMKFVVVLPTIQSGKRLVRVENMSYGTIVYGKVEGTMTTTGAKCYNLCWTNEFPCEDGTCDIPNCRNLYSPADTGNIKKYCDSNWSKDINNYTSANDCINRCSNARVCTENRRDIKEVTDSCNNNYVTWGFSKASNCVNYCYYCPECSSDYIYRPINNYNPFPYSSDSNTLGYNYPTGDRIIPSNWVGKTEYIKQDDKDLTSVTGANANQKVEYVIELTPEAIREIRRDTENYNTQTEGNDAYLDYVYMNGVDTKKRYYSKFINETFRAYFTMINGEEVR